MSALRAIHAQAFLDYLGYKPGKLDGLWGVNSSTACKAFQSDHGLATDGIPGHETEVAMIEAMGVAVSAPEEAPEEASGECYPGTKKPLPGWWDSIRYFRPEEFRCHCGGKYCDGFPAEPAEKLVRIAESIRQNTGKPMTVSSGVRCAQHNANVGGVDTSRHKLGTAMDFCVSGMTSAQVDAIVGAQIGVAYHYRIDGSFVHMDVIL
ncbi:MAG: peptidoglycan-binding protein [Ruminiclostridium sp.]|nr:peptidoglycan-binding protein [Ruminiclostridium sp.]